MASESSNKVFDFLKENAGETLINVEIADGTGLTPKQVVAVVNGLVKKGLAARSESDRTDDKGKKLKVIQLTEDGDALATLEDYVAPAKA